MNAGGRKVGSKNSYRAARRQSQAEKEAQNKKAQATKSANKEKKRKAEEAEAERQKQRNRARFQGLLSGGQTSTTSATSSSAAAAAARGDRSNSNPNGRAAGSNDNRAGRSTPPQEGDALENSNCDTTANQPSIDAADKNEDDEVRCIPAAPSVGQPTNGNACSMPSLPLVDPQVRMHLWKLNIASRPVTMVALISQW